MKLREYIENRLTELEKERTWTEHDDVSRLARLHELTRLKDALNDGTIETVVLA